MSSEDKAIDLAEYRRTKKQKMDTESVTSPSLRISSQIPKDPMEAAIDNLQGNGQDPDLAARIDRIKSSIERINQLMLELRTLSPKEEDNGKRETGGYHRGQRTLRPVPRGGDERT